MYLLPLQKFSEIIWKMIVISPAYRHSKYENSSFCLQSYWINYLYKQVSSSTWIFRK